MPRHYTERHDLATFQFTAIPLGGNYNFLLDPINASITFQYGYKFILFCVGCNLYIVQHLDSCINDCLEKHYTPRCITTPRGLSAIALPAMHSCPSSYNCSSCLQCGIVNIFQTFQSHHESDFSCKCISTLTT